MRNLLFVAIAIFGLMSKSNAQGTGVSMSESVIGLVYLQNLF